MAEQAKAPTAKLLDLSIISGIYIVGENGHPQIELFRHSVGGEGMSTNTFILQHI